MVPQHGFQGRPTLLVEPLETRTKLQTWSDTNDVSKVEGGRELADHTVADMTYNANGQVVTETRHPGRSAAARTRTLGYRPSGGAPHIPALTA